VASGALSSVALGALFCIQLSKIGTALARRAGEAGLRARSIPNSNYGSRLTPDEFPAQLAKSLEMVQAAENCTFGQSRCQFIS
jgi:hypothetical protein